LDVEGEVVLEGVVVVLAEVVVVLEVVAVALAVVVVDQVADGDRPDISVVMVPSRSVSVPCDHANPEAINPLVLVKMEQLHWFQLPVMTEIFLFAN